MFDNLLSSNAAITVYFEQSEYRVNENNGSAQLVLVLSNSSAANFTVFIANPTDGECMLQAVNKVSNIFAEETKMYSSTIPAGETIASFDVQITDDDLIESDEFLQFMILQDLLPDDVGTGTQNTATLIVIDDPGNDIYLFSYAM